MQFPTYADKVKELFHAFVYQHSFKTFEQLTDTLLQSQSNSNFILKENLKFEEGRHKVLKDEKTEVSRELEEFKNKAEQQRLALIKSLKIAEQKLLSAQEWIEKLKKEVVKLTPPSKQSKFV